MILFRTALAGWPLPATALALLAGCATVPPGPAPGATPAVAAAPAAAPWAAGMPAPAAASGVPAARPEPGAPRPFDEVVKGATRQAGFVPLWRKDEKLWLEIAPERLDQPFMLSVNISHSVGERGLYGSQMGPAWTVSFRKIGSGQIQLVALNTDYVADNAPMKAALEQSFSNSLLASAAIASAPQAQTKAVLIDASFLLSDLPGYSTALERAYRLPYGLDRGNSYFEKTRASDDQTSLNARLHFATGRIPAPPLMAGPVASPPPPSTTPDPRSLFIGFVYNFTKLPDVPMAPRRADPRLGHFTDVITNLGTDLQTNPREHVVNRWRLEKADPAAAVAAPKQPIVYWIDKNVPQVYRKAVEAGILEWNKAFEKIGLRNAIVVRQQPDDADFDTLDARHATVRWFTGKDVGFARGPSMSDPRSGEILDADIAMSDVFGRSARRFIVEEAGRPSFAEPYAMPWGRGGRAELCTYAHDAAFEMDFALDLLVARGEIAPDSPEAEAFAQAVVRDTVMHEIGHTLGLKHNFKASTVVSRSQLQDPDFTGRRGISGSVMDYNGVNIATAAERQGAFVQSTLGPYDYWAIDYAYRPIAPADEKTELATIAARSTEPALAYGDDADAGGSNAIDPLVNAFDLGDDPLAFYRKRLTLSRELWQRAQERAPQAGEDPLRQRRLVIVAFRRLAGVPDTVAKYIGGMYALRDLPGTTGRPAYVPVEPARQREALQFLTTGLFSTDSFRFKPEFLASLGPDYNEWERGGPVNVSSAVLQIQTSALDRLMSPGTAARLLDLPMFVPERERADVISLAEVYRTLQAAVWSELRSGSEIDRLRRDLQREHLKRLQALLLRGAPGLPADALSLVRLYATELQADLRRAAGRPTAARSIETRAHLQDSLGTLTEALRASMLRS